jgi:type VI protein secretion system component VasF
VYYTCLGLGFTGFYTGQPEYLRKKMMEIQARVRGIMDQDISARICPEAYEHVDTRPLNLPPLRNLAGMIVVLVAVVLGVLVANWWMYARAASDLKASLDTIMSVGDAYEQDAKGESE